MYSTQHDSSVNSDSAESLFAKLIRLSSFNEDLPSYFFTLNDLREEVFLISI